MAAIPGRCFPRALVIIIASWLFANAAAAHHSYSMFDAEKEVTIEGTVRNFDWTNPHVWIDVAVMDDKGEMQMWGIEARALGPLYRLGWNRETIKPGDKIMAVLHPMRNGGLGGQLVRVTLPNGKVLDAR